jgi:hypothetical protein
MKNRIKLPVLFLFAGLFLSGCIGFHPIRDFEAKRAAKAAAKQAAIASATADKVQAAVAAEHTAGLAALANQQKIDDAEAARRAAVGEGLYGATQELSAPTPDLDAIKSLVAYANANSDPLTAAQKAFIAPIIARLVAKDAADVAAGNAALATSQKQLDATEASRKALEQQQTVLQKGWAAADAQATALSASLGTSEKKFSEYSGKVSATLAKHGSIKAKLIEWAFILGLPWILVYGILPLISLVYPPAMPLSVEAEAIGKKALHAVLLPVHSLIAWAEKRWSKPITEAKATIATLEAKV